MKITAIIALFISLVPTIAPAAPGPSGLPKLGTCVRTTIKVVSQRLEDGQTHQAIPSSGSAVDLASGVYGVSYDQIAAIDGSKVGDAVLTCLVKLPRHCPPGDNRGKVYTTTNLRTEQSWTLPDAEHMCGGA